MEQRPPTVPKLAWVKEEEEEGPGAAPAQQLEEVEQFQPPQEDPAVDPTQEHDPARGRFRRTAQMVCKFIRSIREKETSVMGTGVIPYSEVFKYETSAALLDLLVKQGVSSPEQVSSMWPGFSSPRSHMACQATPAGHFKPLRPSQCGGKGSSSLGKLGDITPCGSFQLSPYLLQVPAMVRFIHRWLMANEPAEHRLDNTLLELTEAQPADVVMTLLRVAPLCDRYGAHLPKGLRAHQPITLWSLSPRRVTNGEFQGPLAPPFSSRGMSAPKPAAMLPPCPSGAGAHRGGLPGCCW
ncbi:uncharacterized protein LOC125328802 isoform X1 [Corvus hawaiiensis]|uniref:uncharacterized protein LOC125328271 isoform X1 n=1 Tax=Corvus hawaiiensis TaxID=134902 RepID=UPI002019DCAA|nr:uncharacterized protein LOC125328271 isoform X1 [Corvus hawaiiensis]XP_048164582.1 uncharacterized protein LOC125328271 isoform X1 [Corvus hawaiiensis]XP_048164608.1 uncharacterized protein LOC125328276 isoform X1 [Corvus hawaiiensis]XP_048164609.1 uncharacterized protein LOC125328276 isoform X1 [Corvus hawaiiensis]XP_048164611.1 uncharacterized protein LOC125328277 isoform X1 [Corvus hawaiiensis]XP_048164612.1 uncharacterized protein LOC125328277 isoform X1 [Corvus hawaiiensis]XP_04816462